MRIRQNGIAIVSLLTAVLACKPEQSVVADAGAASEPSSVEPVASSGPVDPVEASLAFLTTLDKLMEGFVPSLPPMDTNTNVLRCVTSQALTSDPTLKAAGEKLVARRDKSRKEREKLLRDLYALSLRIDYDWQIKQRSIPAVMGCWYDQDWVESDYCLPGHGAQWAVQVPADPAKYVYSQTATAPTVAPELMSRIRRANIVVPTRFSCRVDDVSAEKRTSLVADKTAGMFVQKGQLPFWIVSCAAPSGLDVVLRVSGDIASLNVGDVVSLPLLERASSRGCPPQDRGPTRTTLDRGRRWQGLEGGCARDVSERERDRGDSQEVSLVRAFAKSSRARPCKTSSSSS